MNPFHSSYMNPFHSKKGRVEIKTFRAGLDGLVSVTKFCIPHVLCFLDLVSLGCPAAGALRS